jgi:hypothetical protein
MRSSVTGLPEAQVKRIAEIFAKSGRQLIWAMVRPGSLWNSERPRQLHLCARHGNVSRLGTGANISAA